MDTLGALALATEPPTDHLMHRIPVGRRFDQFHVDFRHNNICSCNVNSFFFFGFREPLITNIMWRNLLIQVLYFYISCLCAKVCKNPWEINYYIKLQATYQVLVLLVLNFHGIQILHLHHNSEHHAKKLKNTLVFNAFIFAQVKYLFLFLFFS